jgi:hypothetical protein
MHKNRPEAQKPSTSETQSTFRSNVLTVDLLIYLAKLAISCRDHAHYYAGLINHPSRYRFVSGSVHRLFEIIGAQKNSGQDFTSYSELERSHQEFMGEFKDC